MVPLVVTDLCNVLCLVLPVSCPVLLLPWTIWVTNALTIITCVVSLSDVRRRRSLRNLIVAEQGINLLSTLECPATLLHRVRAPLSNLTVLEQVARVLIHCFTL